MNFLVRARVQRTMEMLPELSVRYHDCEIRKRTIVAEIVEYFTLSGVVFVNSLLNSENFMCVGCFVGFACGGVVRRSGRNFEWNVNFNG